MLVASGQLWPAFSFVVRHPIAMACILALSLVSTAVQVGCRKLCTVILLFSSEGAR
jgi:hypothetical protein